MPAGDLTKDRPAIFVAGATGAIGRYLVPMLVGAYDVTGMTRSEAGADWLTRLGARVAIVDVFDRSGLRAAMTGARPDVVIHQLTALKGGFDTEQLRATTKLRDQGTQNIIDAMLAAGAQRIVAQSAAWLYAPGRPPYGEEAPLRDPRDHPDDPVLPGIVALESLVSGTRGLDGLVLRYGFLYGAGTGATEPPSEPSVHVAAAARAAALAVQHGEPGPYNIVDDGGDVSNRRARESLGWDPTERDPAAGSWAGSIR